LGADLFRQFDETPDIVGVLAKLMIVHTNPCVPSRQFKNLRACLQAMGTVQGPEEIQMNFGLPTLVKRRPRGRFSVPAEGEKKQEQEKNCLVSGHEFRIDPPCHDSIIRRGDWRCINRAVRLSSELGVAGKAMYNPTLIVE